jgi:riboflavin biosynthesis pyrimidine reductase
VAIVSGSLDIDVQTLPTDQRDVVIITTAQSDIARRRALEARGARVIVAGDGERVGGDQLVAALAALNYRFMYSIAGSMLCHTLVAAGQLHRLYITQAHRLLGGDDFDTIVRGPRFVPPRDLKLNSLYYDATALEGAGQCYALYQLGQTSRLEGGR